MSVSSALRVTNKRLSDEKPTSHTGPSCTRNVTGACRGSSGSHTRTVRSSTLVTRKRLSGLKATENVLPACPENCSGLDEPALWRSRTFTEASQAPNATQRWSRLKLDSITVARRN